MDFKNDTKLSGGCELNFRDTTDRWYNEVDSYTNYDKGCVRKNLSKKVLIKTASMSCFGTNMVNCTRSINWKQHFRHAGDHGPIKTIYVKRAPPHPEQQAFTSSFSSWTLKDVISSLSSWWFEVIIKISIRIACIESNK